MIGVIQVSAAPYRDATFYTLENKYGKPMMVATFPDGMDTHPEWRYNSIKEDYIGEPPKNVHLFNRNMVFNKDVKKWIKSEKWDALIIEGYNSLTNLYAIIYSRFHSIPIILAVDSVENPGHHFFKKIIYKFANAFWVPGKRSRNYLITQGIPKEKIYYGKYTYDYKNIYKKIMKIDKKQMREKMNISDDDIVFLFVGKLIPTRNISLLLSAISEIKNKNLKFIIIGNGPEQHKMKTINDERVIYIPEVPINELNDYYAISNIYVHPGCEPFSLAIVQAVASNLVVISSNQVGAVDDVIIDKKNGILFDGNDLSSLISSINQAIANLSEMSVQAKKMGEFIRNDRNVEYSAKQLLQAINSVKES